MIPHEIPTNNSSGKPYFAGKFEMMMRMPQVNLPFFRKEDPLIRNNIGFLVGDGS